MIDTWFKQDLQQLYEQYSIVVFIDESKEAHFLLDYLDADIRQYEVQATLEELRVKYEIERAAETEQRYLIYTSTPLKDLAFIREYCETGGCVAIRYLENYVKQKVQEQLNLQLQLSEADLIAAAKQSVGKDDSYWLGLGHKGAAAIFDLEKALLPFMHEPEAFVERYDANTQELFFQSLTELMGQAYVEKPASTLAEELAYHLLDGLRDKDIAPLFLRVYEAWVDSHRYHPSFKRYLQKYPLGEDWQPFEVHPSHPFQAVDMEWLRLLGEQLSGGKTAAELVAQIKQRSKNKVAQRLGLSFWTSVETLLDFDERAINTISNFKEAEQFYVERFYKADQAIRKLYSRFLQQPKLMAPLQQHYKNLARVYLDKWFEHIDAYAPNQRGKLQEILDQAETPVAIVVGDGLSWEFADDIVQEMQPAGYPLEAQHLRAGLPSETRHNMSQLYVDSGEILNSKKERERYLKEQNPDKELLFIDLKQVNESTDQVPYLICSCKDPDKLGEAHQQSALQYFDQVAKHYAEKIQQLLRNGYQAVYLLTDHGYVLTGLLEDSDKINVDFEVVNDRSERYIRTKEPADIDKDLYVERQEPYGDYKYCYFAKRLGPFKTPGVYGFSHGGLSPQEVLVPFFKWTNSETDTERLKVQIANKADLKEVTGDIYALYLEAQAGAEDLFTASRRVVLVFFAEGQKVDTSDIISIEKGERLKREYSFGPHNKIEIRVLDAERKAQLDKATVYKHSARDLGGLL